ncbi:MAG TPA: carboxypeptidase regulatory-like domain-containing protein [Verrucomicrobiae bacterium]|nr:carboxypeptidase regulatory-like domain-containing protein [Verrucomicrobiae bacterium]
MSARKIADVLFFLGLAAIIVAGAFFTLRTYRRLMQPLVLRGAVIKQDSDARKQSPIANVVVSSPDGLALRDATTNFSGGFTIAFRRSVKMGEPIRLSFRNPDFQPLNFEDKLSDKLYVISMVPLRNEMAATQSEPEVKVSNVMVRYSTQSRRTDNVGSAVKTFQVINMANLPCRNQQPCSPDGKWKAQVESASLDAGQGNVFRDARVTCIAGPCAFTRIDTDNFSKGGQIINVTVRNWSDTTTFLFQAEVFHSQLDNIVRRTYPVIFGRSMNFTLPSTAEGPTLEADMNGGQIVFPLGPTPILSWASCEVRVEKNESKDYRCELKQGYDFR